jgi:Plasmid pRiA4b ORF-3-like protein
MNGYQFTKENEKCLRDQVITADQPGPVLRDFGVILDFVGTKGVEAVGKYNLLPIKYIGDLDRCLSRPIHLELKRPQLRSHPYLQGLNLLLRASGLIRVEGTGSKARLVLDPTMLAQWDQLNPTEQYFNLLEAWLRIGRAEMVGESGRLWDRLLVPCVQTWQSVREGKKFDIEKPQWVYLSGIGRNFYLLALMDLFGLLKVDQPPHAVKPWCPAGVHRVLFGDAVFNRLYSQIADPWSDDLLQDEDQDQADEDQEDEDDGEGALEVPVFGIWQPIFQPFFPEWRQNLKFAPLEAREGTFIFRVSLGKVWRLIAMPAGSTLDTLVRWILDSVDFDYDHLYEFTYGDHLGTKVSATHPAMDEGPWADQVRIGTLPLEPGQRMKLVYDFGDNWQFAIKLERIEPPSAKNKTPRILERHGKAPEQYPNGDE